MLRILLAASLAALAATAQAVDTADTRLATMPANGGDRIAFAYDNDLWLAGRDGGPARRLTQAAGRETNPVFSPDGRWLAFSAGYDGNVDVYVMPAGGGEARRLTWHPGNDVVRGFTPDGTAVLYESEEGMYTRRYRYLYTVPVAGGVPTRLPVPNGSKAALSPDGRYLAYTPNGEVFNQWKNYRGGTQGRIWILALADLSVSEVPKPAGGSNDSDPMWIGSTLYFRSDRDGEFNLYRHVPGGTPVALTRLADFPVQDPSAHADGTIVFGHAGWLHRLDVASGAISRIRVAVASDLAETRPRLASDAKWLRAFAPAPDLKRVAIEYRGEILTLPADKGDPRNLTASPGVHDRSPAWSPDGTQLAWFADAGGEYALYVAPQDGKGPARRIAVGGAGFYEEPKWSPDGSRIAYRDNAQALWVVELKSGASSKVAAEPIYGPIVQLAYNWSPDSKWLAYTLQSAGLMRTVFAWNVDTRQSLAITDGLSDVYEPVFDPNGEFLYVLASVDAGPVKDWFSQINTDARLRSAVYAVTLRRDGPSALPPQSDEVGAKPAGAAEGGKDPEAKKKDAKGGKGDKADKPKVVVRIDAEGLTDRIVALPAGEGTYRGLAIGASGELYFLAATASGPFDAFVGPAELKRFTLEKRELKTLAADVQGFALSADGKKIVYAVKQDLYVTDVADELPKGKGQLALGKVAVRVEPRAEWAQIFEEAWRINRDWFYATNFHGADWPAMRDKYRQLLPHLATRADLDRVIQMMLSELAVGHSYLQPGEYPFEPKKVGVGLLGADFVAAEGRWRFAKVLGGLNWNARLRAPLRTPGVDVRAGEFLLAVEGRPLTAAESPYAPFEGLAGRQVRLTVGPRADGQGARDVVVVPVESEAELRYFDWVEGNLRYVTEKTGGRVAYVHVPNTAEAGYDAFRRYFYPQVDRQALILDERHNGGGQIADYYVEALQRRHIANWTLRYGGQAVSPRAAIFGPKVLLANETAGSGGDLLPWMWRKFGLGPIVGTRTWGGLVGILGYPDFIDGGSVTAPNLAFWAEDGYSVENEGVAPDIEVPMWPKDLAAGRDPQLDRAIEVVLKALADNPPPVRTPPPLPVRAGRPGAGG